MTPHALIFALSAAAPDGISLTGLTIGGGVIATIGGLLTTWYKSRSVQRVSIEKTLAEQFVTKEEHRKDIAAVNRRIDDFGPIFNRIFKKLNEIDTKAEDRAEKMHRRLDPIIEKVAATAAEVEVVKSAFR